MKITARRLIELLEEQDFRCALSGRELTTDNAVADHRVPVSTGGSNSICNIQIVHADVNNCKGTMSQEEFIRLCAEVASYAGC